MDVAYRTRPSWWWDHETSIGARGVGNADPCHINADYEAAARERGLVGRFDVMFVQRGRAVVDLSLGHYNGGPTVYAMWVDEDGPRKLDVRGVRRMVDAGVLREDERVELLDGVLSPMRPQGSQHAALTAELHERLRAAVGSAVHVRDQCPLLIDDLNLPAPDLVVVRGRPLDYLERHPGPGDALLVVGLAMTSQARDRSKAVLYGRAGIPSYWLLDIAGRTLTVHTDPSDAGYAHVSTVRDTDQVVVPGTNKRLAVAALLP